MSIPSLSQIISRFDLDPEEFEQVRWELRHLEIRLTRGWGYRAEDVVWAVRRVRTGFVED